MMSTHLCYSSARELFVSFLNICMALAVMQLNFNVTKYLCPKAVDHGCRVV